MADPHQSLSGRTVLVAEHDMGSALALQERIENEGGRCLAARSTEIALAIASKAALSDVLINYTFAGADTIVKILQVRQIPYLFLARAPVTKKTRSVNSTKRKCESQHV
jgi:hypothetical protein